MKYNTFIIGVQKAGTTSLHEWLIQHPLVCGDPSLKDFPFFLESRTNEEIKRFENKLNCSSAQVIKITGCVDYVEDINALIRIKEYNSNAKILLLLRNPYKRMISSYNFLRQLSLEEHDSFSNAINSNDNYINRSLYSDKVKSIYEIFESQNIKIIFFEKLVENSSDVLGEVFSFLNLPDYDRIDFYNANKTQSARFKMLNNLVFDKNKAIIIKKIFKSIFTPKTRVYLRRKFKDFNVKKKNNSQDYSFPNEVKDRIDEDILKLNKIIKVNGWES